MMRAQCQSRGLPRLVAAACAVAYLAVPATPVVAQQGGISAVWANDGGDKVLADAGFGRGGLAPQQDRRNRLAKRGQQKLLVLGAGPGLPSFVFWEEGV